MANIGRAVRVLLNAVYLNGVYMFQDKEIRGDCQLTPKNPACPNTRVVTLRFAATCNDAELLEKAFLTGVAELNIEGIQLLLSGVQTA